MQRNWGLEKITLSSIYFNSLRLKYALEALGPVRGKILEVGCGAGAFTRSIKQYRPDLEVFGIDIDRNLIKIARQLGKGNTYEVADVHELPFGGGAFDGVLAFDVIEHLRNPKNAFEEIFRVLKGGGLAHFSIPLEKSLFTIHGLASKFGVTPKETYADHIRQFEASEIVEMYKRAGFSNISINYSGHCLYQLMDFSYFSTLAILRKNPMHTVEGYVESLPSGPKRSFLSAVRSVLSSVFYTESSLLRGLPGQIGHFTAVKK